MHIGIKNIVGIGSFIFGAIGLVLEGKELITNLKIENAKKLTK